MKEIIYILFFSVTIVYSQTDWQKWEAKQISYALPINSVESTNAKTNSLSSVVLKPLKNLYSLLISDYDGDNCPFHPSCATFFIDSVEKTSFFSGVFTFADRFTRDMNVFKNADQYGMHKSGKYFDPPSNYTLNLEMIKLKPEND